MQRITVFLIFIWIGGTIPLSAINIHVPRQYGTIQEGIDAAAPGDTVWIADGLYTGPGNKDLDFAGKSIQVRSENGPWNCIIDCEYSGRGALFDDNETRAAVFQGLTVQNGCVTGGFYDGQGGGISTVAWAEPTILQCHLINCAGDYGGGMGFEGGDPFVSECVFQGNSAYSGGGMMCFGASPMVTDSVFTGNSAEYGGGGIFSIDYAYPEVVNCLFTGNSGLEFGGGVCPELNAGISCSSCTFSGNSAPYGGGACVRWFGVAEFLRCIFWNDTASAGGPEIALYTGGYNLDAHCSVSYCDVQGGESGIFVEDGADLTWGSGNLVSDPLFAAGPSGSYYLASISSGQPETSPCVDAGDIPSSQACFPIGAGQICMDNLTTATSHIQDTGDLDLGYHYRFDVMPPPTVTPRPSVTPTPTATPTWTPDPDDPTRTPTSTPTINPQTTTPTASPTPECPETGVRLQLSRTWFEPGDPFRLEAMVCNGDPVNAHTFVLFIVLDVYGEYYFYPAWSSTLDFKLITVPACSCVTLTIFDFPWPDGCGSASSVTIWAGLTNDDFSALFGSLSFIEFGWSD